MKRQILLTAAAVALSTSPLARFTKAAADGVQLVALPVLPASPFRPGEHDARRDVQFSYDAQQLIETHAARGRRLPVDIEHNAEHRPTADTRSRGWVHALTSAEVEPSVGFPPGVLYAWVELTQLGQLELGDRLWGFTSASGLGRPDANGGFVISRIRSLTLTNNPAAEMPANFTAVADASSDDDYTQQPTPTEQMLLTKILEKLGLTADTPEADVLAAVDAAGAAAGASQALTALGFTAADVPGLVKAEALTAVQGQVTTLTADLATATTALNAANAKVQELTAAQATAALTAAVDAAITSRKATPAQRPQLLAFAAADLTAFQAFVAAAPDVLAGTTVPPADAGVTSHGLTAEEQAKAKTAGITPETFAAARDAARAQLGL